jgi:hypothetical protein
MNEERLDYPKGFYSSLADEGAIQTATANCRVASLLANIGLPVRSVANARSGVTLPVKLPESKSRIPKYVH